MASSAPHPEEQPADLVFEGGGVKGIGLVGALAVLEERGYRAMNRAGASAGAIVATLHAAGYSAAELHEMIGALDLGAFRDRGWEDRIPFVGPVLSVLTDRGVYEGRALETWVRERLAARGVHTFGDLVHPELADDEPRYRHRVQVIVSDVTERRLLVLPLDADRLGVDPNDLDVARAVRMSMSIPVFFEPVRFANPRTGVTHLLVDGGMLSNFPVWLFDSPDEPEWPTFGLDLVDTEPRRSVAERIEAPARGRGAPGVVGYAAALVSTMVEAHDRRYLDESTFVRTIGVPNLGVRTTEFSLSRARVEALYEAGRAAAERFLTDWDFDAYRATFRRREPPTRRRRLVESMRGGD